MCRFRRARGVVVANGHVLRTHAELLRRDLREDRQDALADLGDASDDLNGAAVVEFGPGSGAIDGSRAGDAVPAARHATSTFLAHGPTPPRSDGFRPRAAPRG